ncbi:beta strand repeat-containing protein [Nanoarchaeota archaeon]
MTATSDNDGTANENVTVYTNISLLPVYNVSIEANTTWIDIYNTSNATYLLNITNLGNYPDNFSLTLSSNASLFVLNESQTPDLNPGQSYFVELAVNHSLQGIYQTNITAQSQNNLSVNDTEIVWTNVTELIRQVIVNATPTLVEMYNDSKAIYILNITNNGTINDTYDLTESNNGTTVTFNITTTPELTPGTSVFVEMNVSTIVPGYYEVNATATSQADPAVNDTYKVYTNISAVPVRAVNITTNQTTAMIYNNSWFVYMLNVTNLGNYPDNFTLNAESNATVFDLNQSTIEELAAGAWFLIELNVTDSNEGNYTTNVTVVSDNDASANATVYVNTTVLEAPFYNVTIEANTTSISIYNTTNATYLLNVTNRGNYPDNYTLTNSTNATNAVLNQTTIEDLAPGASFFIKLDVNDSNGGTYETNITVVSDTNFTSNDTETVTTTITELIRDVIIEANQTLYEIYNDSKAIYVLNITNNGTINDTYDITESNNGTTVTFNTTTITNLGYGTSAFIQMNVSSATPGYYEINTTVTSQADPAVNDTDIVYANISALPVRGVNITANVSIIAIYNDSEAIYELNVTNLGNYPDNITITHITNATTVTFNDTTIIELAAGAWIIIEMNISDNTPNYYETNITATSDNDGTANANETVYTNISEVPYQGVLIEADTVWIDIYNTTNATYVLNITNLGNYPDNFTLNAVSNATVFVLNESQTPNLNPGQSYFVELDVGDPDEGIYETNITATSQVNISVNDTETVQTNVTELIRDVIIEVNTSLIEIYNDSVAIYVLNITNNGTIDDSYDITQSNNGSTVTFNMTTLTNLAAGTSAFVEMNVSSVVPGYYEINTTATSQADSTINDTDTVYANISALPVRAVNITANQTTATIFNNSWFVYMLNVTNLGNYPDNFTVSRVTNAVQADLNQTSIPELDPGAWQLIELNVTSSVPNNYSTNVTVTSNNDGTANANVSVNTTILDTPYYGLSISANVSHIDIYNTTNATYLMNITNLGNYPDNFTLTVSSNATTAELEETTITDLAPGASYFIELDVGDPDEGSYETNITAARTNNASANDTATVTTNVTELARSVTIVANDTLIDVFIDENATYELNVTNTGSIIDNYNLILGTNATSAVLGQTVTGNLNPGEWTIVFLNVSADDDGIYETNITAVSIADSTVNDTETVETNVTNQPPTTISNVNVTPDYPVTIDDLICNVTDNSTDPEGHTISYYYTWYKNGVWNMSTTNLSSTFHILDSSNTTKNEEWNCSVIPYDGEVNGTATWDNVSILNAAPTIDVNITPEIPNTIMNLTCSGIYNDSDGDAVDTVYYEFSGDYVDTGTANCVVMGGGAFNCTANVTSTNTEPAYNITCNMTPYDGFNNGTWDMDWVQIAFIDAPLLLRGRLNQTDRESVILNWTEVPSADFYAIYWSENVSKMLEMDPYYRAWDDTSPVNNYTDFTAGPPQERYYRVAAVKNPAPAFGIAVETVGKFNISIYQKVNLISIPLAPDNLTINDIVVPPPDSSYDRITKFTASSGFTRTDYYGPVWKWWGFWTDMQLDEAYYLYPTKSDYMLPIVGLVLDETRKFELQPGVNLVGWSSVFTRPINDVLTPPLNNPNDRDRVTKFEPTGAGWTRTDYYAGYDWWGFWNEVEPGKGYYFYPTTTAYNWTYDTIP